MKPEVIEKIDQISNLILKVQEFENSIDISLEKDRLKGLIKNLSSEYQMSLTNNPLKSKTTQNLILKAKEDILSIEEYFNKKLDLIYTLDNYLSKQVEQFPNLDFKYSVTVLDRLHPIRQPYTVNESLRILRSLFQSIPIHDKIIFLNESCRLRGHKRLKKIEESFGSKECPVFGKILDAALDKKGFKMIQKTLVDNDFVDNKITPLNLLNRFVNFFNKRNKSIADTLKSI